MNGCDGYGCVVDKGRCENYKTQALLNCMIQYSFQAAVKFGQVEPLCLKLEEIGALDHIENLQQHENEDVSSFYIL